MLRTQPPTPQNIAFNPSQHAVLGSKEKALLVNSLAGSGKSAVLTQLAFNCTSPGKTLYLAFNKEIVEDIRGSLPENCNCSTIHAYGLSLIRQHQKRTKIDFNKYANIIKIPWNQKNRVSNLIGFHQATLGLNTYDSMKSTADRFMINSSAVPIALEAWRKGAEDSSTVSAGDMIAIPLMRGYTAPTVALTLVDEAADLSLDKLALISEINTDRIVFMADRNQAIYSFLGSDPNIYESIISTFSPEMHHCNQTFRCPEAIIEEAQDYVPEIFGSKPGGSVSEISEWKLKSNTLKDDALVICRANAPLMNVATMLIKEGRDFRIKKQHIRKIKNILKGFFKKSRSKTLNSLIYIIEETYDLTDKETDIIEETYLTKIVNYESKDWPTFQLKDELEILLAVVNIGSTVTEAGEYLSRLEQASVSTAGPRLSTVHSSKGLQSENLFILKPGISVSMARKAPTEAEETVENTMIPYVGITRSLNNLTYIS